MVALEVLSGEETWKMRHMNEQAFCDGYVRRMAQTSGHSDTETMPRVIMGHTHEVRHAPSDPNGNRYPNGAICLNSGSAGRFEGLIWCIELDHGAERVCSWSRDGDRLKKVVWASDRAGSLVAGETTLV